MEELKHGAVSSLNVWLTFTKIKEKTSQNKKRLTNPKSYKNKTVSKSSKRKVYLLA